MWVLAVARAMCAASERGAPTGVGAGHAADVSGALLDLNSADAEELLALRGIGPVLSARIVEERRKLGGFETVDDLLRVKGVTPELVDRIRPNVVTRRSAGTGSKP